MSLYPVRSISQLPVLSANTTLGNQHQGDRYILDHVDADAFKVENYKAYASTSTNDIEQAYQWITNIPDERLLIETSLSTATGYVARKFDFGNFLRYIGESLRILESRSYRSYLTEPRACQLFLPLSGGTLTGGLVINPTDSGFKAGLDGALVVNQASLPSLQNIVVKHGSTKTTITHNSINVPGTITGNYLTANNNIKCANLTATTSLSTVNITATGNINVTNNVTCSKLTASNNFNLADMVFKNTTDPSFVQVSKVSSNEISVHTGTTTTYNLVVKNDTKFEHDVIVGNDLSVMHNLSAINADNSEDRYHVWLKDVYVKGPKIMISEPGYSTDAGASMIGDTVRGSSFKVGDSSSPSVYADSNGFTCTSKICNLTAQYACWA